jgi:hypothetical protein
MSMSPASPPVVTETAGAGANPGDALAGIQSRAMSALAEVFGLLGRGDRADSSASTFSARASGASALPELQIPWYRPAVRAAAGTETAVELPLENLEDDAVEVRFYSSELSSDGGTSIPSVAVSFDPTTVVLGPRQQAVVTVTVEVPRQAVPGAYSGLVQAEGLARVKAVITVEVD